MPLLDVDCALVIAAGAGTRLRATSHDDEVVKPVTPLLGVPLIVRTLATLRSEGVREAFIVTGYRAEELTTLLPGHSLLLGLKLNFVHNPEWQLKNGVSVLAAREALGGRMFFLSMADHVYSASVVRVLRAAPQPVPGGLLLAIDRRIAELTDPDDAMWVKLDPRGRIAAIGKDLTDYDAVDTGVFLTGAPLFEALALERRERGGDCALADGVRRLAAAGRASTVDIGDAWWQDVDTREDLLVAERKLRQAHFRLSGAAAPPRPG
jgi:choline kinase